MSARLRRLWTLFCVFFKIGAFTFGGGYAMLPIIYQEICEKNHWIDEKEMDKIIVIAQSMPGVMAVNCATQVGHRLERSLGAVVSTCGVIFPSLFIIILLAGPIMKYRTEPVVASAFFMIRAAVSGLILSAAVKMGRKGFRSPLQVTLILLAIAGMVSSAFNPVLIILAGGVVGLVVTGKKEAQ